MFNKSKYKFILQKDNYDCGVAATATLLINSGVNKVNYLKLGNELKLSPDGVSYKNIEKYISAYKELEPEFKINSKIEDLISELKKGRICMVAYQSWGKPSEQEALDCGHYSVVAGIKEGKVYLLDPTSYKNWGDGIGWRIMEINDFGKKWVDKDGGRVVKGWMLSVSRAAKKFA